MSKLAIIHMDIMIGTQNFLENLCLPNVVVLYSATSPSGMLCFLLQRELSCLQTELDFEANTFHEITIVLLECIVIGK